MSHHLAVRELDDGRSEILLVRMDGTPEGSFLVATEQVPAVRALFERLSGCEKFQLAAPIDRAEVLAQAMHVPAHQQNPGYVPTDGEPPTNGPRIPDLQPQRPDPEGAMRIVPHTTIGIG